MLDNGLAPGNPVIRLLDHTSSMRKDHTMGLHQSRVRKALQGRPDDPIRTLAAVSFPTQSANSRNDLQAQPHLATIAAEGGARLPIGDVCRANTGSAGLLGLLPTPAVQPRVD